MKKKILVVGYKPYNESMYPHIYDFLTCLGKTDAIQLDYCGLDDQGHFFLTVDRIIDKLIWARAERGVFSEYRGKRDLGRVLSLCLDRLNYHRCMRSYFRKKYYDVVIAINHSALNMVANFQGRYEKLCLWSHDIITKDCVWYKRSRLIRKMIFKNQNNAQIIDWIIVQDEQRGNVLDDAIMSHKKEKIYFPVSLRDDEFARLSAEMRAARGKLTCPTLMQLTPSVMRGSSDLLLQHYQNNNSHYKLLFKGCMSDSVRQMVKEVAKKPAIIEHENSYKDMRFNISKADIGFLSYAIVDMNHLYMSHASGQLVEYIRLGIPLIVFENRNLSNFVRSRGIGVCINSLNELGKAISEIADNYSTYSEKARTLYKEKFDIDRYITEILGVIL